MEEPGRAGHDWATSLSFFTFMHWRRKWQPTPVLLPGKSHGWRSLEESDTTERLPFHFSLSCIGEGNGNPLQCCCLENPRDGGAWWAAVYGVAQSRTRLKRLAAAAAVSQHVSTACFFLLLNSIPLCCIDIFCLFTVLSIHLQSIHLQLGCCRAVRLLPTFAC